MRARMVAVVTTGAGDIEAVNIEAGGIVAADTAIEAVDTGAGTAAAIIMAALACLAAPCLDWA